MPEMNAMHGVRELLARFSADRDALLVALDQCRSQLTRLAGRLAMEQARIDEVEQLRAELAKAMRLAQRATDDLETLVAELGEQSKADDAIAAVQREVTAARAAGQRFLDETRAHLEVRMDSLAAGFEAKLSSVGDGLWDRVAELQQHVQASDRTLGTRAAALEAGVSGATERLLRVSAELTNLREELLRERRRPGMLGWIGNEVVAWTGAVAAGAWVVGRYTLGLLITRQA